LHDNFYPKNKDKEAVLLVAMRQRSSNNTHRDLLIPKEYALNENFQPLLLDSHFKKT